MTNPDDPAFAHEGAQVAISRDLQKETQESLVNRIAVISKEYFGLTKREYFAAMAMQGCLPEGMRWQTTELPFNAWAKSSLEMADALIAELNKKV